MLKDHELKQAIQDEIECEPFIQSEPIGIAVSNGIVTLTGQVDTYTKKTLAERVAQRVPGVRAVAEEIEVKIPQLYQRSDKEIAAAAANALQWDIMVPHEHVKLKVENGIITLTGKLPHGYQKTAAYKAVRNLTGVKAVYNLIEVELPVDPANVKKEIARVLHRNVERDAEHVNVETSDGVVTLRGSVRSWIEKEDAERAARSTPGVSRVQNFISVGA